MSWLEAIQNTLTGISVTGMMLKKQLQKGHAPDSNILAEFKDQIGLAYVQLKKVLYHRHIWYFNSFYTPKENFKILP